MLALKEYRNKLQALRNTRKMTKTMTIRMIAVNKLHHAQVARDSALPYRQKLIGMLSRAEARGELAAMPLAKTRAAVRAARLVMLTSDRSLCEGFNNNLGKRALHWVAERQAAGQAVKLSFCGKRGLLFFRSRGLTGASYDRIMTRPAFADARRVAADLKQEFLSGAIDEVFLAYNRFHSVMTQTPVIEGLLPVGTALPADVEPWRRGYLLEPDARAVMTALVERYVEVMLHGVLLDSAAGEHATRMLAMENVTHNADASIRSCSLLMNRARQAAITRETLEIIAGAEALKTTA
ncbi:MAG: ATP synthase F1 subunit gamma [Verrucomicrobiota bacterium]|nr:ATP synthase F1 subunit gamma [Verrucomicrobiota bacterium]